MRHLAFSEELKEKTFDFFFLKMKNFGLDEFNHSTNTSLKKKN